MHPRAISGALGALAFITASAAFAQAPVAPLTHRLGDASFTLYGDIDLYFNFMHSTSGANIFALQDGGILRSRLGLKGEVDFGDGFKGNFALEQGINATSGAPADATGVHVLDAGSYRAPSAR